MSAQPNRLTATLERLSLMPDNWDGRHSAAPTQAAIQTAGSIHAVPLGSGGIQLDLYTSNAEVNIEIDPIGNVTSVCWSQRSR